MLVEHQRVAADVGAAVLGALVDLEQTAVGRAPAVHREALAGDHRGGVGRGVDDFRAGVLVLALSGGGDREHLAVRAGLHQVDGGVLHRQLAAEVAVDPGHHRVALGDGALGDEVVDVVGPVLDGGVAHVGAGLADDLDDRAVERVGGVDRGSAALDVVHGRAFVGDDQGALELAHVLGVDPEVGLQGDVDFNAGRDVDEGAAGPDGGVERGELVVVGRDHGGEVLADEFGVLTQRLVGAEEEHALLFQVFADVVVDDFGVVLRADAGQQALLFGLGDAELVVGVLDVLGHIVPGRLVAVGGADVVVDVVEVDVVEFAAPLRHGAGVEVVQRLEAQGAHPVGLLFDVGDRVDDRGAESLGQLEQRLDVVVEAELVLAARGDGGGLCGGHAVTNPSCRTFSWNGS